MSYRLLIRHSAEKELDGLPKSIRNRLCAKILSLHDTPRPNGCHKLKGADGYRLRVGDYRVVYTVEDAISTVTVTMVAHRREVYR